MSRPSFAALMAQIESQLRDIVLLYGPSAVVRESLIAEFIPLAMRYYSQAEVTQWLDSVGMSPTKGSSVGARVGGKRREYNPDGTYTLDGITFGEPRREVVRDFARELPMREKEASPTADLLAEKLLQ